jgi:hypothetical protein
MSTTMIPNPQPGPAARPSPVAPGQSMRFVAMRANLMPDEVIDARRTEVVRRRVLMGMGGLLAVVLIGFGTTWLQTESAKGDLSDQHHRTTALLDQQSNYAPLVNAQQETLTINTKLVQLMVGDVRWQPMYATVRSDAPAGVGITSISAQITTATAGATATPGTGGTPPYGALISTGQTTIGTLTVVGTANSEDQVAAYADRLGTQTGVVNAVIQNYDGTSRPYTFTIAAILTTDALGGRYHVANPAITTQGGS